MDSINLGELANSTLSPLDRYEYEQSVQFVENAREQEKKIAQYKYYYDYYLNSSCSCPHCRQIQEKRKDMLVRTFYKHEGGSSKTTRWGMFGRHSITHSTTQYSTYKYYVCPDCDKNINRSNFMERGLPWIVALFSLIVTLIITIIKMDRPAAVEIFGAISIWLFPIGPIVLLLTILPILFFEERRVKIEQSKNPKYQETIEYKDIEDCQAFVIKTPKEYESSCMEYNIYKDF